jgi:hypothetical protein
MEPKFDFSGQTAIVTGGARGIGRAIATQLVRSGADVWIWDIHPVELNGAQSLSVDVTKPDQIERALVPILLSVSRRASTSLSTMRDISAAICPLMNSTLANVNRSSRLTSLGCSRSLAKFSHSCGVRDVAALSIWDPSQARKACQTWQHIRLRAQV